MIMRVLITLSIIFIIHFTSNNGSSNAYKTLSEKSFQLLANSSSSSIFTDFLPSLLIPRVSGTENNTKVNSFIVNKFTELKWHVETDEFTDNTPYGQMNFSNIIVTKDIKATKRLVFSAHFDSKYFADGGFIGATDSAVPCAILMDLAYSLDKYLDNRKQDETTLQIIFFDGEEAFKYWTHNDSLYGSRHLAAKWEDTYIIDVESPQNKGKNMLSGIDVFILLDLLGASRPTIKNYFTTTSWMFGQLIQIESRLTTNNLIKLPGSVTSSSKDGKVEIKEDNSIDDTLEDHESYFNQYSMNTYQAHIADDHIPFLMRGVPVLHIIPSPFPMVWHELSDDADAIDPVVVYNWNNIFKIFTAEYLNMDANIYNAKDHDELKKSTNN
ncbi:8693_t:CDS:2 [Funneliformis caledonium]|uniref:Peptide hydrolase n=1 Tax=Funneliformis caledonium TaxID=1117310 RepID=A0A9N8V5V4_9GLOM|nr:8693_t:CDS:2 [Funneliformis caledonium]